MSTLAEIEAAVPRLSTAELQLLEDRVKALRQARANPLPPQQTDLSEFVGILTLSEDPLGWQHQIRGEWQ